MLGQSCPNKNQVCMQLDLEWRDLICVTNNGTAPDKISKEPASCNIALRETGVEDDPKDTWRLAPGNDSVCFEVISFKIINFCQMLSRNLNSTCKRYI